MGYLFRRKLDSGEPCAKWTMRYYVGGRRFEESTGTTDKEEAKRILKAKEGDVAKGTAILPRGDRVKFDEAVKDLVTYYTISGDRNLEEAGYRLANLQRSSRGGSWPRSRPRTPPSMQRSARRKAPRTGRSTGSLAFSGACCVSQRKTVSWCVCRPSAC
jgi:hypothetical protein